MFNNYPNYNFNPQQQRLMQLEQQQPIQPPQNKVITCQSEEIAKNTQIALDGTTTYFVIGDLILARNWNIAEGRIDNKRFKLQNDIVDTKKEKDALKTILDMLESIDKKITPATKKKVEKDVE